MQVYSIHRMFEDRENIEAIELEDRLPLLWLTWMSPGDTSFCPAPPTKSGGRHALLPYNPVLPAP